MTVTERAWEFTKGAFGPFGLSNDRLREYAAIIAELIWDAIKEEHSHLRIEVADWQESSEAYRRDLERLSSVLGVALAEHDDTEGEYAPGHMPNHWTHHARAALSRPEVKK